MEQRFKYPKTMHFTFSPGLQNDDRVISTYNGLVGREVVCTEKRDGENTSLYSDYIHARSLDSRHHPSRDWVKKFHGAMAHNIPGGMRICGENLYAEHSIAYSDLTSFFEGFSVWEGDLCLGWDDTLQWFELIGITPVPTLYRGPFDLPKIKKMAESLDDSKQEGLVCRVVDAIPLADFSVKVAKWVRKGHVQTDEHWMLKPVVPNKLRGT